jgi:hypothetical protein
VAVNRGKQFEEQVREGFAKIPNTSIDRLIDPQNGFAGVRNICDFIVYNYPNQYYIECKSCYGNTLSIHSNDPKRRYGNITNNQWEGLLEKSKIPGVKAGVLVWFIDHDETYWLDIRLLQMMRDDGYKSIPHYPEWAEEFTYDMWTRIVGKKLRILFDYDFARFFEEMRCYDAGESLSV